MDGDLRPFTVVGVVGDVLESSLATPPRPTFYANFRQRPDSAGSMNFVVVTRGNETPFIDAALRVARRVAPDSPPRVRTIESIVSTSVADRRRELAVRLALGATVAEVLSLVLRHGATLVTFGIAAGAVVSFVAMRVVSSMLYGIGFRDPVAFAGVSAVLAAVALVACWIPARRAAAVPPTEPLRT